MKLSRRQVVLIPISIAISALVLFREKLFGSESKSPTPSPTAEKIDTPKPETKNNPTPGATSTSTPTNTPTITSSPTSTLTPTNTPLVCFTLLMPKDGSPLPNKGWISFTWGEQSGAAQYKISLTIPSGAIVENLIGVNKLDRYLEALPWGGTYRWNVTALDSNGNPICASAPFTFTKPKLEPTSSPTPSLGVENTPPPPPPPGPKGPQG